jgi:Tol biopolymer transport system component
MAQDIFVRDRVAGTTERVSVSSIGNQANDASCEPAISADGRHVAFTSRADNLVPNDTNGTWDVFVRDLVRHTTELVSVGPGGTRANGASNAAAVSADGRCVAFVSGASNLTPGDVNSLPDVFVRDRMRRTTELVNVSVSGEQANSISSIFGPPSISGDARYVVFSSYATNLVPADINNYWDVFLRDRGRGITQRISASDIGGVGGSDGQRAAISGDGRWVVFGGHASQFVPGGDAADTDILVRDLVTGAIEQVNISDTGEQALWECGMPDISWDGRFVVFYACAPNLVPGDTNNFPDIFVRDQLVGTTRRVSVGRRGEQAGYCSATPRISANGRVVAFMSMATNLVPGDTNGWQDIFVRQLSGLSFFATPFSARGTGGF